MAKYTVCFMATGGIEVEANSYDEAYDKFDNVPYETILENLGTNGVDITEVIREDDGVDITDVDEEDEE